MPLFVVKSKDLTDLEIQRIHAIQTVNATVPIEPVNFSRVDVKPIETPVMQEPIDIPPAEPVFIGEPNQSLQERFRARFGGIRSRIQSRRFQ